MGKCENALRVLVDAVFPPRCPVCDEIVQPQEHLIHRECQKKLSPADGDVCMRCGKPVPGERFEYCADCLKKITEAKKYSKRQYINKRPNKLENNHPNEAANNQSNEVAATLVYKQGRALFEYKGAAKGMMYRFKYNNRREYASFFAEYAAVQYKDWIKMRRIDAITAVPMYRLKKRRRGYNQAEVFARALSKELGLPFLENAVKRIKNTQALKMLGYNERKNTLKKAFQVSENIVQYYHILLVDDIYTTGSTAEAVSEEILKAGEHEIYLLNVCIGQDS